jgi:hypothetical protein
LGRRCFKWVRVRSLMLVVKVWWQADPAPQAPGAGRRGAEAARQPRAGVDGTPITPVDLVTVG